MQLSRKYSRATRANIWGLLVSFAVLISIGASGCPETDSTATPDSLHSYLTKIDGRHILTSPQSSVVNFGVASTTIGSSEVTIRFDKASNEAYLEQMLLQISDLFIPTSNGQHIQYTSIYAKLGTQAVLDLSLDEKTQTLYGTGYADIVINHKLFFDGSTYPEPPKLLSDASFSVTLTKNENGSIHCDLVFHFFGEIWAPTTNVRVNEMSAELSMAENPL